MPESTMQDQGIQTAPSAEPRKAAKAFVKPTLTRHQSLPRVTAGIAGGGSP